MKEGKATVVQKLDSAIHQRNRYPKDRYSITKTNCVIHWMMIYPMEQLGPDLQ